MNINIYKKLKKLNNYLKKYELNNIYKLIKLRKKKMKNMNEQVNE